MSETIGKINSTGQPQWMASLPQKEATSPLEKLHCEIFDYIKKYQSVAQENALAKQKNGEPLQCLQKIEDAIEHGKKSNYSSWQGLFEIKIDLDIPALANVQTAATNFSEKYKLFVKDSQAHTTSNSIIKSHQSSVKRHLQELDGFFKNEDKFKTSLEQLKKAYGKLHKKLNSLDYSYNSLAKNLLQHIKNVEERGFLKKENLTFTTNLVPFWSAFNSLRFRCQEFQLKKGAIDQVTEGMGDGAGKLVENITGKATTDQLKQGVASGVKSVFSATLGKVGTVVNYLSPTPEDPIPKIRKNILEQGSFFEKLVGEMGDGKSATNGVKKIIKEHATAQQKLENEVVSNRSLKEQSAKSNVSATQALTKLIDEVAKAKEILAPPIEQQLPLSQDFQDSCTTTTQLHRSGSRWNAFCGLSLLFLGASGLLKNRITVTLQNIDKKIFYPSAITPFALALASRLVVLKQEHHAAELGAHKLYLYGQKTLIHTSGGRAAEDHEIVNWAVQEKETLQIPPLVQTKLEHLLK